MFIEVFKNEPKILKYVDLPLQHADNGILRAMGRPDTKESVHELLVKLRREIPDISIRTTFLVGFPGETPKAFDELLEFVEQIKFDRLGVFTYSAEEGTYSAEHYADRISQKQKNARADKIMSIQQKISLQKNVEKIGSEFEIIIDREENDFFVGRTQYDSPEVDCEVLVKKSDAPNWKIGNFYNAIITDAEEFDLYAKPKH